MPGRPRTDSLPTVTASFVPSGLNATVLDPPKNMPNNMDLNPAEAMSTAPSTSPESMAIVWILPPSPRRPRRGWFS